MFRLILDSGHGVYSKRNISDQSAFYGTFQIGKTLHIEKNGKNLKQCWSENEKLVTMKGYFE